MWQEIAEAQRLIARIAARQHGIVSFDQLVWAGFSPSTITRRVREGWLHRRYRGVYAVGHIHHSTTLGPADATRRHNIPVTKPDRTRRDLGWDGGPTKSDLERRFLRICHEHGLPRPEVNPRVGPYRPDFLWRDVRLIVEVDGYRYHSDRTSFRRDRKRDRYFQSRGFTVFRFADEDLREPAAVAALFAQRGQE